jgi:hypothetical protein
VVALVVGGVEGARLAERLDDGVVLLYGAAEAGRDGRPGWSRL